MSKSIISDGKVCYFCRGSATDIHHCLAGRNRKKADKYGLTVRLCRGCHIQVHTAVKGYPSMTMVENLHKTAQKKFEEKYSHELWMKEFGRNYL